MTQLTIYLSIYLCLSIMVYHSLLNIAACTIQDLAIYPFYTYKFASANPKLSDPPSPTPLPPGTHRSVLYVCESISVL